MTKEVTGSRKALNFDLNDNLLKQHYPHRKSYKNGWRDIAYFLKKNGFIHRQYSGYVSKQAVSYTDVITIVRRMGVEYTWIKECVMEFDVTVVLEEHSLLKCFGKEVNLLQI